MSLCLIVIVSKYRISADERDSIDTEAERTLRVEKQLIPLQSLLERGAHKAIAWTGVLEDLEVDPEEREVQHERPDDESDRSVNKVFPDVFLSDQLHIHSDSY